MSRHSCDQSFSISQWYTPTSLSLSLLFWFTFDIWTANYTALNFFRQLSLLLGNVDWSLVDHGDYYSLVVVLYTRLVFLTTQDKIYTSRVHGHPIGSPFSGRLPIFTLSPVSNPLSHFNKNFCTHTFLVVMFLLSSVHFKKTRCISRYFLLRS